MKERGREKGRLRGRDKWEWGGGGNVPVDSHGDEDGLYTLCPRKLYT